MRRGDGLIGHWVVKRTHVTRGGNSLPWIYYLLQSPITRSILLSKPHIQTQVTPTPKSNTSKHLCLYPYLLCLCLSPCSCHPPKENGIPVLPPLQSFTFLTSPQGIKLDENHIWCYQKLSLGITWRIFLHG